MSAASSSRDTGVPESAGALRSPGGDVGHGWFVLEPPVAVEVYGTNAQVACRDIPVRYRIAEDGVVTERAVVAEIDRAADMGGDLPNRAGTVRRHPEPIVFRDGAQVCQNGVPRLLDA